MNTEVRLCDDAGLVSHELTPPNPFAPGLTYLGQLNNLRRQGGDPPYEGPPFPCTGAATLAGLHIRCTNEVHRVKVVTVPYVRGSHVVLGDVELAPAEVVRVEAAVAQAERDVAPAPGSAHASRPPMPAETP